MRKLGGLVLSIAMACSGLFGCGANAPAVKHAEYECLEADLASLKTKIAQALTNPTGVAVEITAEEAVCAVEALEAKAGSGSAVPALKLVVKQ